MQSVAKHLYRPMQSVTIEVKMLRYALHDNRFCSVYFCTAT